MVLRPPTHRIANRFARRALRLTAPAGIAVLSASLPPALSSGHKHATAFQNQRKIVKASSGTLALVYQ
jgi:hypothetical protein